jgi:Tfp pilus assembly protein PilZ
MSGETKNVSRGGAFIRCHEPLKPNEVLEVSISVSILCPRVQVTVEVMWSNYSTAGGEGRPRGMGVRFTNIDGTDQELISALVADHLQEEDLHRPEGSSTV